jgi:uncharacterized protein YcfJ
MQIKYSILALGLVLSPLAQAAEYGNVLSSVPVMAQVPIGQQQCTEQPQMVQEQTSGGGALLGAVIGGVVGNNVGKGFGRALATGVGVMGGAVLGNHVESVHTPQSTVPMRVCQNVPSVENRLVGYDVTYEYQGQRYQTRLRQDPGRQIALNVNVAPADGAMAPAPMMAEPQFQPQQAMPAPAVVYVQPPAMERGYYYYAPPPTVIYRGGYRRYGY